IVFDTEAPIQTPEWLNTIDATAPTSHVTPLPGTACSAFSVQWSGTDAHSGVFGYDLLVSDNGGAFTLWLPGRTDASQTFVGEPGHAYAFYSIARDAAGNEEAAPGAPDASTNAADPSPVVGSLEPTSGPAGGGNVDLTGNGFLAGLTLSVGGSPASGLAITDPQTMSAVFPGLAPGALHDVTATNTGGCGWTFPKAWFADFLDVDQAHPFHRFVENIFRKGVTAGCSVGNYCPANPVTRAQMAVFLLKSKYGAAHVPPTATGTLFFDVPASNPFAPWIEQLANEGITGGCGSGNYCPSNAVTRSQMAVFLLKSRRGPNLVPPPATGVFADVPTSSPFAPWIEMLAAEEITGGCGGPNYCPGNPVTRGQMAVFLSKTFGYVR
ncbi:MAG: S-layer homology domain-containing protein, partial [Thermoanaerobaculia bacterium]